MSAGVYVILRLETGDAYLGSSSRMESRLKGHRRSLLCGTHWNVHLQRAWNAYGADAFAFLFLAVVPGDMPRQHLYDLEQAGLDMFRPTYNLTLQVCYGGPSSPKHLATMSAAQKRRFAERPETKPEWTPERRAALGAAQKRSWASGHRKPRVPFSAVHRARLGEVQKGRVRPQAWRDAISEGQRLRLARADIAAVKRGETWPF